MREKIISESVGYLDKTKQDMVKNLVKDVPTEKLTESVKKYIPMILGNSSVKSINKNSLHANIFDLSLVHNEVEILKILKHNKSMIK